MSEVLIFASTKPQYDDRLFIELQAQNMFWAGCGLVDAKIRAYDKDLPLWSSLIKGIIVSETPQPWIDNLYKY